MATRIQAVHAAGIWQLELFVNVENAPAIALNKRHGFAEAGRIPNAIHGAQGLEDDLMMIRTDKPDASRASVRHFPT